jgi:hypothetical protein
MWKIFLFSLSLFFYVLGFRKNTLNNKKDDVKIYDDDELRKKIQKLFSFVFFSSFVVAFEKHLLLVVNARENKNGFWSIKTTIIKRPRRP